MKKTTREFGVCPRCNGDKVDPKPEILTCIICNGRGRILIKETIEESDDMKEFIEKKCGWELVEARKNLDKTLGMQTPFIPKVIHF